MIEQICRWTYRNWFVFPSRYHLTNCVNIMYSCMAIFEKHWIWVCFVHQQTSMLSFLKGYLSQFWCLFSEVDVVTRSRCLWFYHIPVLQARLYISSFVTMWSCDSSSCHVIANYPAVSGGLDCQLWLASLWKRLSGKLSSK